MALQVKQGRREAAGQSDSCCDLDMTCGLTVMAMSVVVGFRPLVQHVACAVGRS